MSTLNIMIYYSCITFNNVTFVVRTGVMKKLLVLRPYCCFFFDRKWQWRRSDDGQQFVRTRWEPLTEDTRTKMPMSKIRPSTDRLFKKFWARIPIRNFLSSNLARSGNWRWRGRLGDSRTDGDVVQLLLGPIPPRTVDKVVVSLRLMQIWSHLLSL